MPYWMRMTLGLVAALCGTALITLAGFTTHASHMRDLDNQKQEMIACIDTDRTAADCRFMAYGDGE